MTPKSAAPSKPVDSAKPSQESSDAVPYFMCGDKLHTAESYDRAMELAIGIWPDHEFLSPKSQLVLGFKVSFFDCTVSECSCKRFLVHDKAGTYSVYQSGPHDLLHSPERRLHYPWQRAQLICMAATFKSNPSLDSKDLMRQLRDEGLPEPAIDSVKGWLKRHRRKDWRDQPNPDEVRLSAVRELVDRFRKETLWKGKDAKDDTRRLLLPLPDGRECIEVGDTVTGTAASVRT